MAVAKAEYGGLNILVNNAGTNELCAFPNIDVDQWHHIFDINVTGPMLGAQTCAPLMKASVGGAIVNVASLGGKYGAFSTAYSTSKWAMRGLSINMGVSYAKDGIRSNCIDPGFIAGTGMTDKISANVGQDPLGPLTILKRSGKGEEIAGAALFYASDEASYVTGTELPVDGGLDGTGPYSVMGMMQDKLAATMAKAKQEQAKK